MWDGENTNLIIRQASSPGPGDASGSYRLLEINEVSDSAGTNQCLLEAHSGGWIGFHQKPILNCLAI